VEEGAGNGYIEPWKESIGCISRVGDSRYLFVEKRLSQNISEEITQTVLIDTSVSQYYTQSSKNNRDINRGR
jgi:hypothetical protein